MGTAECKNSRPRSFDARTRAAQPLPCGSNTSASRIASKIGGASTPARKGRLPPKTSSALRAQALPGLALTRAWVAGVTVVKAEPLACSTRARRSSATSDLASTIATLPTKQVGKQPRRAQLRRRLVIRWQEQPLQDPERLRLGVDAGESFEPGGNVRTAAGFGLPTGMVRDDLFNRGVTVQSI